MKKPATDKTTSRHKNDGYVIPTRPKSDEHLHFMNVAKTLMIQDRMLTHAAAIDEAKDRARKYS